MTRTTYDRRLRDPKNGEPLWVTMDQRRRCEGIWFDAGQRVAGAEV